MGITKMATNIKVNVKQNYTVITATFSKTADEIKMDATKDSLIMNCLKKINTSGEKTKK